MQNLIKFFIENYKLTIVLTLGIFISGINALNIIRSESFPSVDFAMVTVNTQYRGASAADVEALITIPIEKEIKKVSGIKDIRSLSQDGISDIFIRIDMDNVNVKTVISDLQKAVDRVSNLPSDLAEKPLFTEIKSEEFPALEIAIIGDNENRARDDFAKLIRDELEDISGVLEVRLVNYGKEEYQVLLDPTALDKHNIGINEVLQAISARNLNIPSGDINNGKQKSLIKLEGKVTTPSELNDIIVRRNFSSPSISLADLAVTTAASEEKFTLARFNGQPATLAIILKKAGSDTTKVANAVEKRIQELFASEQSFHHHIYLNEADRVKAKLKLLSSNALTGFALVVIFLLIFLPGKIGFVASLSLPLCILGLLAIMAPLDINIDTITVLAMIISLGMLVDNSVVVSENVTRLRQDGYSALDAAIKGAGQIWLPITATALTTIAAFLPMLVTKGVMGRFIEYIPIIVTLALSLSLLESLFLLPMRIEKVSINLTAQAKEQKDWFKPIILKFESFINQCVQRRYLLLFGFTSILFFSFFMLIKVNKHQLFPSDQIEIYVGRLELAEGTALEKTYEHGQYITQQVQDTLRSHLKGITYRAGTNSVGPLDPKGKQGSNTALILIYIKKESADKLNYKKVLEQLRTVESENAVSLTFQEQVNGPPVGDPINATLRSSNEDNLATVVSALIDKLSKTPGVLDVQDDVVYGGEEIYIDLNHQKISRLGLSVKTIGDFLKTAFQGMNISTIVKNSEEININVRFSPTVRQSIDDIKNLRISDPQGNLISLGSIAQIRARPGSPQLKRFDYKRAITITGNVDLSIINSKDANKKLLQIFQENFAKDYPDVTLTFGGEEESTQESMESLANAGMLAAIGIYAVLVFVFNSFAKPFIIMSTIPLGLLGITLAFWAHDKPISFLALVGIIGLAGIIVNNGIVLISFIDEIIAEKKLTFANALARASSLRLRAVTVTSITTVAGLLPTAYGIGGSDATLTSMTLAMAWGLTTGTIMTLIWIPCAVAILEDIVHIFKRFSGTA